MNVEGIRRLVNLRFRLRRGFGETGQRAHVRPGVPPLRREDAVNQSLHHLLLSGQAVWYWNSRKSSLGMRLERFSISMPTT